MYKIIQIYSLSSNSDMTYILDTIWRESSFQAQAGSKDTTLCWSLKVHLHFEAEHWVQVTSGCIIFQVWLLADRCLVGETTEMGPVCSECLLASAHSRLTCSSPAPPPFWKVWHRPSAHHLKPLLTWETGRPLQIASSPPRPCWCKDSV